MSSRIGLFPSAVKATWDENEQEPFTNVFSEPKFACAGKTFVVARAARVGRMTLSSILSLSLFLTMGSAKEEILVGGLVEQVGTSVGTYLLLDSKHPDLNKPEVFLMENVVHPGAPDAITWRNEKSGGRTFFLAGLNGRKIYVVARQSSDTSHAVPESKILELECLPAYLGWDEESQNSLRSVCYSRDFCLQCDLLF